MPLTSLQQSPNARHDSERLPNGFRVGFSSTHFRDAALSGSRPSCALASTNGVDAKNNCANSRRFFGSAEHAAHGLQNSTSKRAATGTPGPGQYARLPPRRRSCRPQGSRRFKHASRYIAALRASRRCRAYAARFGQAARPRRCSPHRRAHDDRRYHHGASMPASAYRHSRACRSALRDEALSAR